MSFGTRLQALRHSSGMTQEEFAQQLKVSRQAVSKWESSRGYPEIEKIIYICNCYGVTMDELFFDEVAPARQAQASAPQPPAEEQPLKSLSLKRAVGNFFANLPPATGKALAVVLTIVILLPLTLLCISISKGGSIQMIPKFIWLGLLILFGIGEAVTVGLTSIWFAAGSLAALLVSMLGGQTWLQITVFLVVSLLCLLAVRPLAHKYLKPGYQPTNADRVIGAEAIVTEEINNLKGEGAVSVNGMVWTARTTGTDPIPVGAVVRVERIEGVKLYVCESKEATVC